MTGRGHRIMGLSDCARRSYIPFVKQHLWDNYRDQMHKQAFYNNKLNVSIKKDRDTKYQKLIQYQNQIMTQRVVSGNVISYMDQIRLPTLLRN